jgi:lipopolysaccharide heptosyltransferase I
LDAEQLRRKEFSRILIIKLSALGDVIHTVPVLHKLRRRYPSARIDWLTSPAMAELLRPHPAISSVMEIARNEWLLPWRWSSYTSAARVAARLASMQYDLVIDMHGQLRTAFLTLAAKAPVRIGFDRPRSTVWQASARVLPKEARRHAWKGAREGSWIAYTHHIPVPTLEAHAVDRYLRVGAMLGCDNEPADFSLSIAPAPTARIQALLNAQHMGEKLLVIAPGTIWETKHWRAEGFAEAARHFMTQGFSVALIGSDREVSACEAVASGAPGAVNLAGQTSLPELAALIQRSTICLTNDSGPMHLAVALGRPVVSIFGPTDPIWIGPYRRPDAVLQAKLSCSPCYLRVLSRCAHDHACMQQVSAAAVIDRMERELMAARDYPAPRTEPGRGKMTMSARSVQPSL